MTEEYEVVEPAYTGTFIEEEFILDSGEKVGFAEKDWLIEVGVSQEDADAAEQRQFWRPVRKERDRLLAETDWTQNNDVPQSTRDRWAPYRQALRDITDQSDPNNVVWPTKPS